MAAVSTRRRNSGPEPQLHHDLPQPSISRPRTASLTLPTSTANASPFPRRLSLSPWQPNPQLLLSSGAKRGLSRWKPIRMLSHIGKQRLSCFFSVEITAIRNLPESMDGVRLAVCIRKPETRDGAVRTMPARVLQGSAEFQETLFIQCHVYCSGGAGGKPIKIEPRPFLVSVAAVDDAPELELGRSSIDLSQLIRQMAEGARIRRWDAAMKLTGKAEGGELAIRVGFQIMDDGVGIYSRIVAGDSKANGLMNSSATKARKQSKNSFSISTLDSRVNKMPTFAQPKAGDLEFEGFEIFDKGTENWVRGEHDSEAEDASTSSVVVKKVVHNQVAKQYRLQELDSICREIEDLESMMSKDLIFSDSTAEKDGKEQLDAEDNKQQHKAGMSVEKDATKEPNVLLPNLGNGLGPVIQTKDGGFLASMNPFNVEAPRAETPKLALQISKPFVLHNQKFTSGLEIFQRLSAVGLKELCSRLLTITAMDELCGKTSEQIAFEGIASGIKSGRSKEGANSSAAKSMAAVKAIILAMSEGRNERVWKETWSVKEKSIAAEEILAFSMQRMEEAALEALKIQEDMCEEEAPFNAVLPVVGTEDPSQALDSIAPLDEWEGACAEDITLLVLIQLRDPIQQYEAVGAPFIALMQGIRANDDEDDQERRYKVIGLHVGGVKVRSGEKSSSWNGERSKLAASQWLVANGMGKVGKKGRPLKSKLQHDILWSLSSRIMEDVWLRPMRNPDVKIAKQ